MDLCCFDEDWTTKEDMKIKFNLFLLSNLALSDLLMGIYMIIIASADAYSGQHYTFQMNADE